MKTALIAPIVAFATAAWAQSPPNISSLPQCAQTCISQSFSSITSGTGGCSLTNYSCICNSKSFITTLSCCISTGCSAADQQTTIQFAQKICQAYTSLPTTATCASTGATGGGSTAMTGSTSGASAGSNTATAASAANSGHSTTTSAGLGNCLATPGSAAAAGALAIMAALF